MDNLNYIARIMDINKRNPRVWENLLWDDDTLYSHYATVYYRLLNVETEQILRQLAQLKPTEYLVMSMIAQAAIVCLITHKDCGYMMDSDISELKLLVKLGDERAILLYPACLALRRIDNEK